MDIATLQAAADVAWSNYYPVFVRWNESRTAADRAECGALGKIAAEADMALMQAKRLEGF